MDIETVDQAESQVPPEIAALAANMDAELGGQALAPGAAMVQADTRATEAAEIAALLGLAVKVGGYVEPAVPKYYTDAACQDIGLAFVECAEKYGWTWHKSIATGPELKLGAAIAVPAFLIYQERMERARLMAAAATEKARQASQAAPVPVAAMTAPQPGERVMPSGS